MPRQILREFAGAIYHVMNRGDRREEIFRSAQDRRLFLTTLTGACAEQRQRNLEIASLPFQILLLYGSS
jgi:hypothetical protein